MGKLDYFEDTNYQVNLGEQYHQEKNGIAEVEMLQSPSSRTHNKLDPSAADNDKIHRKNKKAVTPQALQ